MILPRSQEYKIDCGLFAERIIFAVFRHPNHLQLAAPEGDAFANRILVREITVGYRLVDDHNRGAIAFITIVEFTAHRNRRAHSFEEPWTHKAISDVGPILALLQRIPFGQYIRPPVAVVAERKR